MNDPSELLALAKTLTIYAASAHANQKRCIFANMRALLGHSAAPLSEESSKKKKKKMVSKDRHMLHPNVQHGPWQGLRRRNPTGLCNCKSLQQFRVHSLTQTTAGGKRCLVP